MIPPDVAADIRDWQARQERSRAEHARNPHTHSHVTGPCLVSSCGRITANHDGYCSHHREQRPRRNP